MPDNPYHSIGRVSGDAQREQRDVDPAQTRPPPREPRSKNEFERVMRDSKKTAPLPKRPTADKSAKKKGPSLFELSGGDGRAARDLASSKSTKKKEEALFSAEEMMTQDESGAQAQLAALQGDKQTSAGASGGQGAPTHSEQEAKLANPEEKARAALAQMGLDAPKEATGTFATMETAAAAKSDVKAVIKQIAEHLAVLRAHDRQETTVTIKHPPLFDGATLTLVEHHHAKGEFNVRFHNLNPDAKALIENWQNQDLLRQGMEARGFALHQLTASTEKDLVVVQSEQGREANDEGAQDEGEQKRERDENQDEE